MSRSCADAGVATTNSITMQLQEHDKTPGRGMEAPVTTNVSMRVFDYKVQLISHAPRDTTTTQHVRGEFRHELVDRSAQGTPSPLPSQVWAQGGRDTSPALAVHPVPRAGRIYLRHLGIARR